MVPVGDLSRGGHQARWIMLFEATEIRKPLWRRVRERFRRRRAALGAGIAAMGTGYEQPVFSRYRMNRRNV